MLQSLFYYLQFGQADFLLLFFILLLTYLAWRVSILLLETYVFKTQRGTLAMKPLAYSLACLTLVVIIVFTCTGVLIEFINTYPADRVDIARNNNLLMEADRTLFGTYVPLWFQLSTNPLKPWFDSVAEPLIWVYNSLSVAIGLMLVFLLIVNGRLFVHFFAVFIICLLLSIPAWYLFPAISPVVAYIHPLVQPIPSSDLAAALSLYQPNASLQAFMERVLELRQQADQRFLLVITTIPSMHIAWVAALTYFGIAAWRPLAVFLVPYFILNNLSTVYTLQHYAVDILAGCAVAAAAIVVARWLQVDRWPDVRVFTTLIRNDLASLKRFVVSWGSGQ